MQWNKQKDIWTGKSQFREREKKLSKKCIRILNVNWTTDASRFTVQYSCCVPKINEIMHCHKKMSAVKRNMCNIRLFGSERMTEAKIFGTLSFVVCVERESEFFRKYNHCWIKHIRHEYPIFYYFSKIFPIYESQHTLCMDMSVLLQLLAQEIITITITIWKRW